MSTASLAINKTFIRNHFINNQTALTLEDMRTAPDVVSNFDSVKLRNGNQLTFIKKLFNDNTMTVTYAFRNGELVPLEMSMDVQETVTAITPQEGESSTSSSTANTSNNTQNPRQFLII